MANSPEKDGRGKPSDGFLVAARSFLGTKSPAGARLTLANLEGRRGLPRITYPITFNGRTFSAEELGLIQTLTTDCATRARTELASTLCELLDWRRPTGTLKNHEGRLLLEPRAAKGLVRLPPGVTRHDLLPRRKRFFSD